MTLTQGSGANARRSAMRLAKMYAALTNTLDVVLRSKSAEDLYRWVCEAAVHGSKFLATSIYVPEPGNPLARMAAGTGAGMQGVKSIALSMDESHPGGRGTIGKTFREQKPHWTNDYLNDESLKPWHDSARAWGWNAAISLPLVVTGESVGVLSFFSSEKGEFDDEMRSLLDRLARNVSFALEKISQEEEGARKTRALRESEGRFRSLTTLSSDWFWEQDSGMRFVTATGVAVPVELIVGKTFWDLPLKMADGLEADLRAAFSAQRPFRDVEYELLRADGSRYYGAISGEPVFTDAGEFVGYRGVGRDITERKLAQERIYYMARHDSLTSLPNRAMFGELLNLALSSAKRYQRKCAVMFLDLDGFKVINDSLGHHAGDTLLQEVGRRLTSAVRASDVVARLGGDEFVILLQEVAEDKHVAAAAHKILSIILKPVVVLGQECRVTASIGVCMYPDGAQDEQSLMKNADMAMYRAKEEGKNNFQLYSDKIKSHSLERMTLETNLRRALDRNEFLLHYQAKRGLKSGQITGVEALLRWQHPDLGEVSPMQFIPLAEETGLIVPIGRWVLETACGQNAAWQRQGLPPVRMAVNLSARQFADEKLLDDISAALGRAGMSPAPLELELTESMLMHDIERAIKLLGALKDMGVHIAVDDFGVGYSSLAQIKRFPIDTLKIDRSFIRELPGDAEDCALTEAIIALGRSLSLTVIAEGVETREQEKFLHDHGCNEMQGYHFSRPIAAEQFGELLRQHAGPRRK